MPKMAKTTPPIASPIQLTEAVFYPCFGVVYGRFRVDFTQKWGDFGYFSGKYGVWKG